MNNLRITEIFYSLQGETNTVGLPTVFIRLTGCPLRCLYCDTTYAFKGGENKTIDQILSNVSDYQPQYVTVTGGEPLAQKNCLPLLTALCNQGYQVSLETSGAVDVSEVDPRVIKIVDLKTPASGELEKNLYSNINFLNSHDQVKFVICDENDYEWAKKMIHDYKLTKRCEVLFSPSHQVMPNQKLADWILRDRLPIRFQIQLHKYIWGDVPGK
ncbi:MAG: 7-carboxy-7-deazaguanine synthase QueE [Proteobacteria bacterium]|nr:7-carboxy-7-deazaguanine synthase QueE [Pseudomonadota bacterium]